MRRVETAGDEFVTVLRTPHVVVRARPAVIEIRRLTGGRDQLTAVCGLLVGTAGIATVLTGPVSVATWVLGPVWVVFALLGGWILVQRWIWPSVHLDCVAWTVQGAGVPRRRRLGGPPTVHTTVARVRGYRTGVALSAGNRSTDVLGTIPDAEAEEIARTLRRLVRERTLRP